MRIAVVALSLIVPFVVACSGGKVEHASQEGDTLHFKYAKNISIVRYGDYTKVELADPWRKNEILHTYILAAQNHDDRQAKNANNATFIRIPLTHSVISTSVHSGLAAMLNRKNVIAGLCDVGYIKSPWLIQQIKSGRIVDCGNSMSPNVEKVIALNPDAIFLSPIQNTGGYGKIEGTGIPIVELADYMEPTAIGRAEWIKFYGILWGAEQEADSIFKEVEHRYLQLKTIAGRARKRPKVLVDKVESGIWYQPGGKSTMAELLKDANAEYAYAEDNTSGSIQKSLESVIERNSDSDVWIMRYYIGGGKSLSLKELEGENKAYSLIRAYKEKRVFGCNTASSNFFEEGPFRPDYILKDFILITHPELRNVGETRYFRKLK